MPAALVPLPAGDRKGVTMGAVVCAGATMQCSMGVSPSTLNVLPLRRAVVGGMPAATVADNIPMVNVPPFALCTSLANPAVVAATAAALGVLTPMPCTPVLPSPWLPGSPTVLVGGLPALNDASVCACAYGGVITLLTPGQMTTVAP